MKQFIHFPKDTAFCIKNSPRSPTGGVRKDGGRGDGVVPSIAPSHEPHLQRNEPTRKDDAPDFWYDSGEKALAAVKKAIKGHIDFRYQRSATEDGRLCFEVVEGETVPERQVGKPSRTDFAK